MSATIERVGAEAVDHLRPLFLALRAHHEAVAPHLGETWDEDTSWSRRRATYQALLAEEDAVILVARDGEHLVGLAVMTIDTGSATWRNPERYGWVHDLVVLPTARGGRIGEQLVDALWQALHAEGVSDMRLAIVATNDGARRFYERVGFEPSPFVDLVSRRPAG